MTTAQPPVQMTDSKPYLIRAIHEWILENNCIPHLIFVTGYPGVDIPTPLRSTPTLTLNISMAAADHLIIGNEFITFAARFGGKSASISVPIASVMAIVAKDTNHGLVFEVTAPVASVEGQATVATIDPSAPKPPAEPTKAARPSFLKVVK